MNNLIKNKKFGIILGGLALIIIAGLVLHFLNKESVPKQAPLEVKTTELGDATIPAGFPRNLPSEIGSKVIQNYESVTNDGRKQSAREVTSKLEPRAALNVYIDFFKTLGYEGGYSEKASVKDGQQVAQMKKDKIDVLIVANPSTESLLSSTVLLTLTEQKN